MIHFLQKLADFLFEPILLVSLFGGIAMIRQCWAVHKKWLLLFLLILSAMMSWRIYIQIASSRYNSVFIFPALLGCAYAIIFCAGIKWPNRPRFLWGWLLLGLLIALSIGKITRLNPYSNYVMNASSVLKRDFNNVGNVWIICPERETNPVKYYTQSTKVINYAPYDYEEEMPIAQRMKILMRQYCAFADRVYFLSDEPGDEPLFIQDEEDNQYGTLKQLYWQYKSRRHKRRFVLYRFEPAYYQIRPLTQEDLLTNHLSNIPENGDFEIPEIPSRQKKKQNEMVKRGSPFYGRQNLLLPYLWWFWFDPKYPGERIPHVALTSDQPLKGQYSLYIRTTEGAYIEYIHDIPVDDYKLTFWVRVAEANRFAINYMRQNFPRERFSRIHLQFLQAGDYVVTVPIRAHNLIPDDHFKLMIFSENSEFILDQFSLEQENILPAEE